VRALDGTNERETIAASCRNAARNFIPIFMLANKFAPMVNLASGLGKKRNSTLIRRLGTH
jgi:hypothetical protein